METDPRIGKILAGKYTLVRCLGAGGMGAVYEAENNVTGRRVAVKLLTLDTADPTAMKRLIREARAATKLQHDHIIDVLDLAEDTDGTPFLVQELLVGQTLQGLLNERGSLPPEEARGILLPVMRALGFAHSRGVIHRDVKPDNIFLALTPSGRLVPKVIDFGIARPADDDLTRSKLTRTGAIIGTPLYMSPEQARGDDDLDARADVWSVGVVLYEMLTGTTPFNHGNLNRVLAAILTKPAPRIESVAPDIPADLAAVVHTALASDRNERYASMEDFARALESVACGDVAQADTHAHVRRHPPANHATLAGMGVSGAHGLPTAQKHPGRAALRWTAVIVVVLMASASVLALRARATAPPPVVPRELRAALLPARPPPPTPIVPATPVASPPPETTAVTPTETIASNPVERPTHHRPDTTRLRVHRHPTQAPASVPQVSAAPSTSRPVVNAAPVVGL